MIRALGVLSVLSVCVAGTAEAGSWRTVDELPTRIARSSQVQAMAASRAGVFAAGNWVPAPGGITEQWLVRRSEDLGESWRTVDSGVPGFLSSGVSGIASDESGSEVYAVGWGLREGGGPHGVVRKSDDGGTNWSTIRDDERIVESGVSVDPRGRVFLTGSSSDGTWITELSTDGGRSWSVVDRFQRVPGYEAGASAVRATGRGVFAAGFSSDSQGNRLWTVRYSEDGLSWRTVDLFDLPGGPGLARGIATGGFDRVTVVGYATDSSGAKHGIVRSARIARIESPDAWRTLDDVSQNGADASAIAAVYSPLGRLFVTGSLLGGTGSYLTRESGLFGGALSKADELPTEESFIDGEGGFGAAVDRLGGVYTGGNLLTPENDSVWIVRKLDCLSWL